jgi:hypothetical protein
MTTEKKELVKLDKKFPKRTLRSLDPEVPESNEFPEEALSKEELEFCKLISESLEVDISMVAHKLLEAQTLILQAHANIEIDGRVYPLNEFFLTLADSSERKSATHNAIYRPIIDLQEDFLRDYKEEFKQYEKDLVTQI